MIVGGRPDSESMPGSTDLIDIDQNKKAAR